MRKNVRVLLHCKNFCTLSCMHIFPQDSAQPFAMRKKTQFYAKKNAQTKQKIITQQMFPLFLVEIFAFTFMNCPCDFCTGEICRYPYISKLASVQLFVYYLVYLDSIKPASIKCLLQLVSCGF